MEETTRVNVYFNTEKDKNLLSGLNKMHQESQSSKGALLKAGLRRKLIDSGYLNEKGEYQE